MGTRLSISRGRHQSGFARFGRSGAAISLLAGALVASGCASYVNVPEPDSAAASVTSPNRRQPRAVMKTALVRVIDRFPPGTRQFAVGLPEGVSIETIDEILGALGPGAELAGPRTGDLPTYSIGRIWIRSGKAKVDIFRPVSELGPRADGTYERQAITVWLEGGLDPWHITRMQRWEVGAFPRPDVAATPGLPPAEASFDDQRDRVSTDAIGGSFEDDVPAQPEAIQDDRLNEAQVRERIDEGIRMQAPAEPTPTEPATNGGFIRIETVDDGG